VADIPNKRTTSATHSAKHKERLMTQKTIVSSGSQGSDVSRASASPDVGAEAKQAAGQVAGDVKQLAGEAADHAKHFAQEQIATRKDRAVTAIAEVAEALRASSGRLSSNNEGGQYVTRVADGLDSVSTYFKDRELTDVIRDVEGFARREPAIFLGGAFVLGLVGSRFIKSSRAPRAQAGQPGGQLSTSSAPSYRIGSSSAGGPTRNGEQYGRSSTSGTSPRPKSPGGPPTGGPSASGTASGGPSASTAVRPPPSPHSPSASASHSPGPSTSPSSSTTPGIGSGSARPPANGPRGGTSGTA
jgi:uncharacterized protein YjbJ (UPF0337 family)